MSLEFSEQGKEVKIIKYFKEGETYIFRYKKETADEVLRTLGRFASNPQLSFTWYDAAVASQKVRQERNHKKIVDNPNNRLDSYLSKKKPEENEKSSLFEPAAVHDFFDDPEENWIPENEKDEKPVAISANPSRLSLPDEKGIYEKKLIKNGETYIFRYRKETAREALCALGRFASNPELSFSWYDAAVISQDIRRAFPV